MRCRPVAIDGDGEFARVNRTRRDHHHLEKRDYSEEETERKAITKRRVFQ